MSMSAPAAGRPFRPVPLSCLVLAPENVRKTAPHPADDAGLKASIEAHGLLENLVVRAVDAETPDRFAVIAGGRRLAALQSLHQDGAVPADHPVPCIFADSAENAGELSLAENAIRVPMHPADQVTAFTGLAQDGFSVAVIAARFGVTERIVEQRIRLGNVAPEILEAYRADEINLETVKAFAVTTDQVRQKQIWENLRSQPYRPTGWQVKQMLTEHKVSAGTNVGRFVGVEAYEQAGGRVLRDLFADEHQHGVWFEDPPLLERLATAKLKVAADELATPWKWAEAQLNADWNTAARFARVQAEPGEPTAEETARLDRLNTRELELSEIYNTDDGSWTAEHEEEFGAIEAETQEIQDAIADRCVYSPEAMAISGCIVTIGYGGELEVIEGLVRPEDQPSAPASGTDSGTGTVPTTEPACSAPLGRRPDPAAQARKDVGIGVGLSDDMTAIRTSLVKAHLSNDFDAAFDLALYQMALSVFGSFEYRAKALSITTSETAQRPMMRNNDNDFAGWSPGEAMLDDRSSLSFDWMTIDDTAESFAALRSLPHTEKQALFAAAVARTLNGQLSFEHRALPQIEATVARLDIDFAAHVRPTADMFWSRINKSRILDIARATLGAEWATAHSKFKKADLAKAMETAFAAGDVPLGVTPEGHAAALAWTMPGFTPFDTGRIEDPADEREPAATAAPEANDNAEDPAPDTQPDPAPETAADPAAPRPRSGQPGHYRPPGHRRAARGPGAGRRRHERHPHSGRRPARRLRHHRTRERPRRRRRHPGFPPRRLISPDRRPNNAPPAPAARGVPLFPLPIGASPMNPPFPPTIRARVHESAVSRVTRLFDSGLRDIFTELFQNSRRAGATRVNVTVEAVAADAAHAKGPEFTITIDDDGAGIADPAVLLSFGQNGWDAELVRSEDAAGFGFASLARRGCSVSTRTATPSTPIPAWQVALAPSHFLGEHEAPVEPCETAPFPHGTAIRFPALESPTGIRHAAEAAARHYPLPVHFQDRPGTAHPPDQLESIPFLDGAIHTEQWHGLVIGAFRNRPRQFEAPTVNFHGLTVSVHMPYVYTVSDDTWSVRIDVENCPDLELVLPARKEIVQTPFLDELRKAARLAIYRAMASEPDPCPSFEHWKRARDAGIAIPPPEPRLRRWRPSVADVNNRHQAPRRTDVAPDSLVMSFDPESPEAQTLHRAFSLAGLVAQLFEADRHLEGYDWYDRLDRVVGIRTEALTDGNATLITDVSASEESDIASQEFPARPEDILVTLAIQRHDGTDRTLAMATDVAIAGEAWSWPDDACIALTRESSLQPHELSELLESAYFSPSDDCETDSYETQREHFRQEASHMATSLICGSEEALRQSILDAMRREVRYLIPRDRAATINIQGPDITLTLAPPSEAA